MNANKHATPTEWIDPDDAPELTDEFFEQADEYIGDKLIRRGRPKAEQTKQALTVRYDAESWRPSRQPAKAGKRA